MGIPTLPYKTLIEIDRYSTEPIFKQVASALISLIRRGKLTSGFQLPASRELALALSLNRSTILSAYNELLDEGWLSAVTRKGYFVATHLPLTTPTYLVSASALAHQIQPDKSFYRQVTPLPSTKTIPGPDQLAINDGYPDVRLAPLDSIYERYRFLAKRTHYHNRLLTDSVSESQSLRHQLAIFLTATRGLSIDASHILVTHGAQLAIFIAASMMLRPGSTVIVADLNYVLADRVFEQLGAQLIKVKVDEHGIDVDQIERICERSRPDLLYIIPHHHHPTTVTLSKERRIRLLDIIRTYRLPVIEDDYDYDFHYAHAPILPLASAEHDGLVIYIGSISKTLAPTVRLGYLVASADFVAQAARFKQVVDIRGDVLFEASVAHLFHTGSMQRHLRRSLQLYKQRRDTFCDLLQRTVADICAFSPPAGGMAVWATFDPTYSIVDLAARLSRKGIYLNDGSRYPYHPAISGLRLGFASLDERETSQFFEALKVCR